jgi:RNA polymerase sigma-70 factor (ECF subfamily)
MDTNRVLVATSALPSDADQFVRAQLERNLSGGYRLATVILGSASDAEDAVHDAVERAWRARATLRDAHRFDAWFQRIVVNACRDRIRRRRAAPTLMTIDARDDIAPSRALADGARDPFADTAERDALRRAFARLSLDQRVVVAMRFYLDLEIDEIARRLGTRSGTVKSRLHRGIKVLRTAWEAEQ